MMLMPSSDYVVALDSTKATDGSLVGGKAANLSRLIAHNISVPSGFCVTTEAFRAFLDEAALQKINSCLRGLSAADFTGLERVSSEIRETILSRAVPDEITTAIAASYGPLALSGDGLVAVRSSVNIEDSDETSFAGQFDTFLRVEGIDAVLAKVRACWASLWTARAIAYRIKQCIAEGQLVPGVIVQKMVLPDAAGVMFTCSPLDNKFLMIESTFGLGEALMRGAAAPDRFLVDRSDCTVFKRHIVAKMKAVASPALLRTGVALEAPDPDHQVIPSLSDRQAMKLAEIGMTIERVCNAPQDIEWAQQGPELFVLQARPITTDTTRPENLIAQEREELRKIANGQDVFWTAADITFTSTPASWENFTTLLSNRGALGVALRRLGLYPGRESDIGIFDQVAGRRIINHRRISKLYYRFLPIRVDFKQARQQIAKGQPPTLKLDFRSAGLSFWLSSPWYLVLFIIGAVRNLRLLWTYRSTFDDEIVPRHMDYIRQQEQIDLGSLSNRKLICQVQSWRNNFINRSDLMLADLVATTSFMVLSFVVNILFQAQDSTIVWNLLKGIEGNLTTQCGLAMESVANGEMSFENFLQRFGHRNFDDHELAATTWSEDQATIKKVIDTFETTPAVSRKSKFAAQQDVRKEAEAQVAHKLKSWPLGTGKLLLAIIRRCQQNWPLRENYKHHLLKEGALLRMGMLLLGQRYGLGDGIFFLESAEIDQIDQYDMHELVEERRKRRRQLRQVAIPEVIFSDALEEIGSDQKFSPTSADEIQGVAASPGVAVGTARIVRSWEEWRKVLPGDVLVVPKDDPGLTAVLMLASAVVVEAGNILGHGAVLSREFGIPAVVSVKNATQIADAQSICVDGNKGIVSILHQTAAVTVSDLAGQASTML